VITDQDEISNLTAEAEVLGYVADNSTKLDFNVYLWIKQLFFKQKQLFSIVSNEKEMCKLQRDLNNYCKWSQE